MLTWADFSGTPEQLRGAVRGAIEEASAATVQTDDPAIDELIAAAQQYNLALAILKIWIYDQPHASGWSVAAFLRWARRAGFIADGEPQELKQ
jgi:hypothetical protein